MIEVKVSHDTDRQAAQDACRPWAALALTGEEKSGIEDPLEMERAELVFHLPGDHQAHLLDAETADVLPKLRDAYG